MEKKKIFVVEDESIVSLEIQSRIKHLGYTVSGTAASGDEAIRKVIDLKPDLILMDIRIARPPAIRASMPARHWNWRS